jgi:hypothetical protein
MILEDGRWIGLFGKDGSRIGIKAVYNVMIASRLMIPLLQTGPTLYTT